MHSEFPSVVSSWQSAHCLALEAWVGARTDLNLWEVGILTLPSPESLSDLRTAYHPQFHVSLHLSPAPLGVREQPRGWPAHPDSSLIGGRTTEDCSGERFLSASCLCAVLSVSVTCCFISWSQLFILWTFIIDLWLWWPDPIFPGYCRKRVLGQQQPLLSLQSSAEQSHLLAHPPSYPNHSCSWLSCLGLLLQWPPVQVASGSHGHLLHPDPGPEHHVLSWHPIGSSVCLDSMALWI